MINLENINTNWVIYTNGGATPSNLILTNNLMGNTYSVPIEVSLENRMWKIDYDLDIDTLPKGEYNYTLKDLSNEVVYTCLSVNSATVSIISESREENIIFG